MADKHPNDDYTNPVSRTAPAPIPPESPHDGTGEKRAEDPDAPTPDSDPAAKPQPQSQAKKQP